MSPFARILRDETMHFFKIPALWSVLIIIILAGTVGCGIRPPKLPYIEVPVGAGKAEASALVEEGNRAFRNQAEEKELRRAIELFQRAFAIDPYYPGLGGQLGYAHYLLADNVIPFEKEEERQEAYRLGRDYALKGLEANGMMRDVLQQKSGDLQDAIAFSTKDDLGAMYWAAIRPGSGIIRRMWLRAIRRRAEA